jgi:enoyl-CoA hydratase
MFLRKTGFLKRFSSTFVSTEQQGAVFSIILNRPEVKNAVNKETAKQLRQAFVQFENDVHSRIAVVSGASGTFCAGYDLNEVSKLGVKEVREIFMSEPGPMVRNSI